MSVWAIGDLHLAFGVPSKSMEIFGPSWEKYSEKIASNWRRLIEPADLVLIPGDISWAKHLEEAEIDLKWIADLPGTKLILRGNHDYWWQSLSKIEKVLPPNIYLIQNNCFFWNEIAIGGAKLYDTPEYQFSEYIDYKENLKAKNAPPEQERPEDCEKIFQRELLRLENSLKGLDQKKSKIKIAMTHYPPIGATLEDSKTSLILEKYGVSICVFGHLHSLKPNLSLFGTKNGIQYILTSSDYLNFVPVKLI